MVNKRGRDIVDVVAVESFLLIDGRHDCEMIAERNGRIIKPWPRCVITLVFMRAQWYRAKVHQPRQDRVRMVGSVCTRQTGLCFASCHCVDYIHKKKYSDFFFDFLCNVAC